MNKSLRLLSVSLLFMTILLVSDSCKSKNYFVNASNGKTIDSRLVGVWEGSEEDNQIKGVTKEWKMTRTKDGKFVLDFKATVFGEIQQIIEEGQWWIEDEIFYEFHNVSGKTDTYNYTVLNKDQIKFKAISLGVQHDNQEYEFIDTRVRN